MQSPKICKSFFPISTQTTVSVRQNHKCSLNKWTWFSTSVTILICNKQSNGSETDWRIFIPLWSITETYLFCQQLNCKNMNRLIKIIFGKRNCALYSVKNIISDRQAPQLRLNFYNGYEFLCVLSLSLVVINQFWWFNLYSWEYSFSSLLFPDAPSTFLEGLFSSFTPFTLSLFDWPQPWPFGFRFSSFDRCVSRNHSRAFKFSYSNF